MEWYQNDLNVIRMHRNDGMRSEWQCIVGMNMEWIWNDLWMNESGAASLEETAPDSDLIPAFLFILLTFKSFWYHSIIPLSSYHSWLIPPFQAIFDILTTFLCHPVIPSSFWHYILIPKPSHHSQHILLLYHHLYVIPSFLAHSNLIASFLCHPIIPSLFRHYTIIPTSSYHSMLIPTIHCHSDLIPSFLFILLTFKSF